MDLRHRLISPCAIPVDTEEVQVDLTALALNLILFENFIIQSIGLKEIPHLIRAFGYDVVLELLSAKGVEIHCDAVTIGQTGQLSTIESRRRKGFLPLGSFSFSAISIADRAEYVHSRMQPLHKIPGLSTKQVIKLKAKIAGRLIETKSCEIGNLALDQLRSDLRSSIPALRAAVVSVLREKLGQQAQPDFFLKIEQIDETDFKAETNLMKLLPITDEQQHEIIAHGLLAVGGLNQRLAEMKIYSALSGFRDGELSLFENKLDFLARSISPEAQKERFNRVIAISGFQDLDILIKSGKLDLPKLLEVRDSTICREFREWIWSIDSTTDTDLEERVRGLRERLSWFANGKAGKTLRWLAGVGLGFVPGATVVGATYGLLDTFIINKLFPNPGAISFLNKLYPSIFTENPRITPANFLKM